MTARAKGKTKAWIVLFLLLWAVPASAQFALRVDPVPQDCKSGWVPGIKVSINNHGDPLQPWVGDCVAFATFIDNRNERTRIWSQVASVSVYGDVPVTAVATEIDVNNVSSTPPDEPGGVRALYGLWLSGAAWNPYLGSAAILVSSADGSRWRNGIFIDRADVGLRIGGTFQNGLGIDLAQSRIRFRAFTATPPSPPAGSCDVYVQNGPSGTLQLVLQCPHTATVLGEAR